MGFSRTKRLFSVHESTRRAWCRGGLICFGLTPFVFVVLGGFAMMTPWYRSYQKQQWESRISDNLGVTVRTESFQITAPQQFRATRVEVRHPETNALIARVERVDGLMKPHGWSILLEDPVLDGTQMDSGLQVLHDWFLCRPQKTSNLLAIGIPNGLKVHTANGVTQLDRIELLLRPTESSSTIQSKIAFADQPFGELSICVTRDHRPEAPATRLEVSSTKIWLDCNAWIDRLPLLKNLGNDARFRGIFRCNILPDQWDASAIGDLDNVDWSAVTSAMGSPVRGHGSLHMDQLNLRDGKILRVSGEMRFRDGEMHYAWLRRLAETLQLPAEWTASERESLQVDEIGFGFALDTEGLRLQGLLPGPKHWPAVAAKLPGIILCTNPNPLSLTSLVHGLQAIPTLSEPSSAVDLNAVYLTSILPWPNSVQPPPLSNTQSRLGRRADEGSIR
ncbi:MAG: hypothetical protein WCI02_08125 [Planctomycetota bacterium]